MTDPNLLITLKTRITSSLKVSSKPMNKEFWYGFLVGLNDYQVISFSEYQNLRNFVDGY